MKYPAHEPTINESTTMSQTWTTAVNCDLEISHSFIKWITVSVLKGNFTENLFNKSEQDKHLMVKAHSFEHYVHLFYMLK